MSCFTTNDKNRRNSQSYFNYCDALKGSLFDAFVHKAKEIHQKAFSRIHNAPLLEKCSTKKYTFNCEKS
jgi:hypothetical protein